MKKIVLSSLAVVAIASGLFAQDNLPKSEAGVFVGIGMMKGSTSQTQEYSGNMNTSKEFGGDVSSMPITIGYVSDVGNKVKFSYETTKVSWDKTNSFTGKKEDEYKSYNFDIDFSINKLSIGGLTPYLGFGIGYHEIQNTEHIYVDHTNLLGYSLNLNVGANYKIIGGLDAELAYKYKKMTWADSQSVSGNQTISLDDTLSGIYVGLNYKF